MPTFSQLQSSGSSVYVSSHGNVPLSPLLESEGEDCSVEKLWKEGMVNEGSKVGGENKENVMIMSNAHNVFEKAALTGLSEFCSPNCVFSFDDHYRLHLCCCAWSLTASLMQLLISLGRAYQLLMKYDLGRAVRLFQSLPPHHWETPWVLGQVGQAYFAAERYEKVCSSYTCPL